jgi:hypothetical protein
MSFIGQFGLMPCGQRQEFLVFRNGRVSSLRVWYGAQNALSALPNAKGALVGGERVPTASSMLDTAWHIAAHYQSCGL